MKTDVSDEVTANPFKGVFEGLAKKVNYYEVIVKTFNRQPIISFRYIKSETETEESVWFDVTQANEVLHNWRNGSLLGSFGIGTVLAKNASFQIVKE